MKLRSIILAAALLIAAPVSTFAQVSSGIATSAAPTYTNNSPAALSLDLNGNLRVTGGGGGGGGTSSAFNAAFPADGTAAGALDSVSGDMVPFVLDNATGGVQVTCVSGCGGSGGTSSTFGAAFPTDGTAIGALDSTGTNMVPLNLDASGNLDVNVGNASIPVTQSGTWNVGTVTAVTSITNAVTVAQPTAANLNATVVGTGTFATQAAQSGTWTVQPGNTANTTPWLVTNVPPTTQADTLLSSAVLAASTNATSVKGSAGALFNVSVYNNSATIAYLKLYNSASAPTCGSGTPVLRYIIPASTSGAGSNVSIDIGAEFTSGIGYCVTTGISDSDTGAVAASAYIVNLIYK